MENNNIKYIVYCTTNIVNKKIYIGVHKTEKPYEFDGYLGNGIYNNNSSLLNRPKTKFANAVKKYGFNNFVRSTIAKFDTAEEAFALEAYIVNEDFLKRNDIYNMALGGDINPDTSIKVYQYDLDGNFIKEYKSQTEAANAIDRSQGTLWKALTNKTRCNNYFWTTTKYDKLDLSKMHLYEDTRKIPVFQYSLNGEYDCCYESIKDAARVLNLSDSNIGAAVKLGSICGGKYFSSVFTPEFSNARKRQLNNTPIYQYSLEGDFIAEYSGMPEAKKKLGITSNIYQAIKLGRTAGNFQWRFEKYDKIDPWEKPKTGVAKSVGKYDSNGNLLETYKSLAECKKINGSGVAHVLSGRDKTHKGYIYKYL